MKKIITMAFVLCMMISATCAAQHIQVNNISITIPDTYSSAAYLADSRGICYANFKDTAANDGVMIRTQPSNISNAITLNDVSNSKLTEETNAIFSEVTKAGAQIQNTPNFTRVTISGYPAMMTQIDEIVPQGHMMLFSYTILQNHKFIYIMYSCPADKADLFQPAIEQMNSTLHIE